MSNEEQPAPTTLTIRQRLESPEFAREIAKVLPKHLTPERMVRVACTAIAKIPELRNCTKESFFGAMLRCSEIGIEPDGRRAHLIPFRNNKTGTLEVQLIIDYKGIAELVMRTGLVSFIHADVVCENDVFAYDKGQIITHKIDWRTARGSAYAVYALCRFKDGTEKADVMSVDDVEKIRMRSRAKDFGPWKTDWAEMAKKTVFRRLSKWLPLSPEIRDSLDDDEAEVVKQAHATVVDAGTDTTPKLQFAERDQEPTAAEQTQEQQEQPTAKRRGRPPKVAAPAPEPETPLDGADAAYANSGGSSGEHAASQPEQERQDQTSTQIDAGVAELARIMTEANADISDFIEIVRPYCKEIGAPKSWNEISAENAGIILGNKRLVPMLVKMCGRKS